MLKRVNSRRKSNFYKVPIQVHVEEENINNSLNITNSAVANSSSENIALSSVHPAGIILTR